MVPILKRLAAYHRVYAPDLPGCGESEKPRRVLNVARLSDYLAAWMREIGLERGAHRQLLQVLDHSRPGGAPSRTVRAGRAARPRNGSRARTVLGQVRRFVLDAPHEPLSLLPIELLDYLSAGVQCWLPAVSTLLGE